MQFLAPPEIDCQGGPENPDFRIPFRGGRVGDPVRAGGFSEMIHIYPPER